MKRRRKTPLQKAKDKLWGECKRITRLRYENHDGTWNCFTCEKHIDSPAKAQTGHFIPSSVCSTEMRYDLDNLRIQCLTAHSNIKMQDGSYKSISNILVGDVLSAFNEETFEEQTATVLNVSSFMPEELYEVELENGDKFYSTADHKVVTKQGWKRVDEMLHAVSAFDIMEI